MKSKIVDCDEGPLNRFLATPGIKILTKHVVPPDEGCSDTMVLFFFEDEADIAAAKDKALLDQAAQLDQIQDLAREIANDSKYAALKNNTQKEIYLSAKYNLTKSDAGIVIEMLKPEMLAALGA